MKRIIAIVIISLFLIGGATYSLVLKLSSSVPDRPLTTIDFEDCAVISFVGWNNKCGASVEFNMPEIDSYSKREEDLINEFVSSINYKLSSLDGLKNGDVVTVTVDYDKTLAEFLNIKCVNEVFKTLVNDLLDDESSAVGELVIPSGWNLSQDEMEDYVVMMDEYSIDNDIIGNDDSVEYIWEDGNNRIITYRTDKVFEFDYYDSNQFATYMAAREYGLTSSQTFCVMTYFNEGKLIGYICKFKD